MRAVDIGRLVATCHGHVGADMWVRAPTDLQLMQELMPNVRGRAIELLSMGGGDYGAAGGRLCTGCHTCTAILTTVTVHHQQRRWWKSRRLHYLELRVLRLQVIATAGRGHPSRPITHTDVRQLNGSRRRPEHWLSRMHRCTHHNVTEVYAVAVSTLARWQSLLLHAHSAAREAMADWQRLESGPVWCLARIHAA